MIQKGTISSFWMGPKMGTFWSAPLGNTKGISSKRWFGMGGGRTFGFYPKVRPPPMTDHVFDEIPLVFPTVALQKVVIFGPIQKLEIVPFWSRFWRNSLSISRNNAPKGGHFRVFGQLGKKNSPPPPWRKPGKMSPVAFFSPYFASFVRWCSQCDRFIA